LTYSERVTPLAPPVWLTVGCSKSIVIVPVPDVGANEGTTLTSVKLPVEVKLSPDPIVAIVALPLVMVLPVLSDTELFGELITKAAHDVVNVSTVAPNMVSVLPVFVIVKAGVLFASIVTSLLSLVPKVAVVPKLFP